MGSVGDHCWFNLPGEVFAEGGDFGNVGPNGGAGTGTAASSIGDTVFAGGDGTTGIQSSRSGAGGGGAGTTGAGGDASGTTGGSGTSVGGGDGANGRTTQGAGGNGSVRGGGGGGGARATSSQVGGDGANGYVVLTWTVNSLDPGLYGKTRNKPSLHYYKKQIVVT